MPKQRGLKVIIAAAGMAAHLPGVIASMTTLPVIGVPIKASLEGLDALLAIVQMPPGIPVATVGINASLNAGILAAQMIALHDEKVAASLKKYKEGLKKKIVQANEELSKITFKHKIRVICRFVDLLIFRIVELLILGCFVSGRIEICYR